MTAAWYRSLPLKANVRTIILAILKVAPQSLAVQYLETIQNKDEWKKQWQSKLLKENIEKTTFPSPKTSYTFFTRVLKTLPLEKELLQCSELDANCLLLALLRYQDIDGLTYKDAIQFMKKSLQKI